MDSLLVVLTIGFVVIGDAARSDLQEVVVELKEINSSLKCNGHIHEKLTDIEKAIKKLSN